MTTVNDNNFERFRDCLSASVIEKLSQKTAKPPRRRKLKGRKSSVNTSTDISFEDDNENDPAELSDFMEYLAEEMYTSISEELRTISFAIVQDDSRIAQKYALPLDKNIISTIVSRLPPSIPDSFCSYGIIEEPTDLERFLDSVLNNYVTTATAAPPEYTPEITASRPDGCEICGREHLQLTYHHLIPRQIHAKAVKRGWHKEWQLNKVCWLCRACHSYVHRIATNEQLAKEYYDVDLLLAREDIQKWAAWVRNIRWKSR